MNLLVVLALSFEVATVKVSAPIPVGGSVGINLGSFRNGRLTLTNVTLAECLQYAYALPSQDQISGPDWIKSRQTQFDIVAKAPPETDGDSVRQMLRSLLAERLKLVVRVEEKPFAFAALVQAKAGSKLVEAPPGVAGANSGRPGLITGQSMPMAVLASLLSRFEGQLVVDRTGLAGRYQFKLEWEGASLSSALEDQLGLHLEPRKEPLDVVVVESAQQTPIDN
ncbi:MAG TPA: TIGR03435 family protein [Vicinamibacterales bacterium]|nr:TIGR03435 family protein [Vicinamibacterales bacterium]